MVCLSACSYCFSSVDYLPFGQNVLKVEPDASTIIVEGQSLGSLVIICDIMVAVVLVVPLLR